jgi:UTP--glucose-1-phosphate uridylyltransferase
MNDHPRYLVIPAAGLGTRMQAVRPDVPKEMLEVGLKPAIQYAVAEGHSAGIKDIIIIINREKEIIRQYFEDRSFRKNKFPDAYKEAEEIIKTCSITFLYQEKPLGESDAIGHSADIVGNHSLAIIYPDNIYFPAPGAIKTLIPPFRHYGKDVLALMEMKAENATGISNSGRVDIEPIKEGIFRIKKFHPKGEDHFDLRFQGELRTCGIAVFGPHIFEYIDKVRSGITEKEFTDTPIRNAILAEKEMLGCRLPGTVFDIGNPTGYSLCLKSL